MLKSTIESESILIKDLDNRIENPDYLTILKMNLGKIANFFKILIFCIDIGQQIVFAKRKGFDYGIIRYTKVFSNLFKELYF